MSFYAVDTKRLADAQRASETGSASGGGAGDWLKMGPPGLYTLRILPPWSAEGLVFRALQNHNDPFAKPLLIPAPDGGDWRVAPMCYRFLFSDAQHSLAKTMIQRGVIKHEDAAQYEKYGCPLCILPRALQSEGDKEAARDYWPRRQYIFNVALIDAPEGEETGRVYLWSANNKAFKAISVASSQDDLLFDPKKGSNMTIEALGKKGAQRRYTEPQFARKASSIPDYVTPESLFDLDTVAAKGVRSFEQMVEIVRDNRVDWDDEVKLGDLA